MSISSKVTTKLQNKESYKTKKKSWKNEKESNEDDNNEKEKYYVNTAKKLLIHIGDAGGHPIWCVGLAIKRAMWKRYAKESNKGRKLLKRSMTRRRNIFCGDLLC